MSLAALLAKSKLQTAPAAAAPVAPAAAPAVPTAVPAPAPVIVAPMSGEDQQLVTRFRKSMDHLSAALADPKYAIPVSDAVRDIGMTIREHPHLNTLIEPQDFAHLVRVITESAQYKARATASTKNERAVKTTAKSEADNALASVFSLDGLSGSGGLGDLTGSTPKKPAAVVTPPSANAGVDLVALLSKFKKG